MYGHIIYFVCIAFLVYITEDSQYSLAEVGPYHKVSPTQCTSRENKDMCLSPQCKAAAEFMSQSMDFSVNPCKDFYSFTCGKFTRKQKKPLEELVDTLKRKVQEDVRDIVHYSTPPGNSSFLHLVKNIYFECINLDSNILEFQKIFSDFGGFPMLMKNYDEKSFSWVTLYKAAMKYGYDANNIFRINVGEDIYNTSRRGIYIDDPKDYKEIYTWEYDHITFDEMSTKLGDPFIMEILKALGADEQTASTDLGDMIWLRKSLDGMYKTIPDYYYIRKMHEMEVAWPDFPWLDIIQLLLQPQKINGLQEILVSCPSCMDGVNYILKVTPKRIIANYFIFGFILENIFQLERKITNTLLSRLNSFYENTKTLEDVCQDIMYKYFYDIIDYEYTTRTYKPEKNAIVTSMIGTITQLLNSTIKSDYLYTKEDVRKAAIEKLNAMGIKIANDPSVNLHQLNITYGEMISNTSHKFFLWDMKRKRFLSQFKDFHKVGKTNKYMTAITVNAYQVPVLNTIFVAAGLLQDEAVSTEWPAYMNYARAGFFIAHEIMHGYTISGMKYDKDGNYNSWADNDTSRKLWIIANCLVLQHNQFPLPFTNKKVNSTKWIEEMLADNGAVYLSYTTYTNRTNTSAELSLPGFQGFTPKQMFWISMATAYCEHLSSHINYQNADHPYKAMRILGSLQNAACFARDFECAVGTFMNPKDKCTFLDPPNQKL